MEISEGVIRRGRNTLLNLRNCSQDTQPHSLFVKYQILPQGMSVYPPKTYWSLCTMVTVLFLPSHLSWKVWALQPCEVAR